MQKILLFIMMAVTLNQANSQSCLPEGIVFFLQSQIDNFQIDYPNCTQIEGDVEIEGSGITNLNGLNVLTTIGGSLTIYRNFTLTSLTGLEGLSSIGGSLQISNDTGLPFALINLAGLENLTTLGENLLINNCLLLTSLTGLEGLTSIGGNVYITDNIALTSLTGLVNVTSIGGDFVTYHNAFSSLSGLNQVTNIGRDLDIESSHLLTSMTGLESITSIGRDLIISNNNALTSVSGFDNLTSLGGPLDISFNPVLGSLEGFETLTTIGNRLSICYNSVLTSLSGLNNIDAGSVEYLDVSNNPELSSCAVQSICDIIARPAGSIGIFNNAAGCNTQEEVETACATISVENITRAIGVSIYPNPSSGFIYFNFDAGQTGPWKVRLTNALGTMIEPILVGYPDEAVDISGLTTGIYFYQVIGKSHIYNGKLVKL
jgi:hypothetical protein